MLTLWLIRHGETAGNAGVPAIQSGNLTKRGQRQAEQIAATVARPPHLIVTSPLWRTKQTAQPTCDRFPTAAQAEWLVQEFSYLDADQYQAAKTPEQRRLLDQKYWQRSDPDYVSGEGAESFSSLMTRVKLIHDRLHHLAASEHSALEQSEHSGSDYFVLVFSHAWFMRAVVWSLLTQSTEISPQQMWRLHNFAGGLTIPNGSIFKVQVDASEIWFTGISTAHLCELLDQT